MNPKDLYTDTQKDRFCTEAVSIGIYGAMKELGYPKSRHTAQKWMTQRNLFSPGQIMLTEDPENPSKAAQMQTLDKLTSYVEDMLSSDVLAPDDVLKLAQAMDKVVSTVRLIEDKPTHISSQSLPPQAQELLAQLHGSNQAAIARARTPQSLKELLELSPSKEPAHTPLPPNDHSV